MPRAAVVAASGKPFGLRGRLTPDATESSFVSASYTVTADGVTTDALTFTAETAGGSPVAGREVTFTVERVFLSASLSTVDAAPGTIADDGVETSTVEVQVKDTDGNNAPGIGFAQVVLAATGANNTLVQPSTRTDAQGRTSGTLASTTAATKVANYTVSGLAITETASIVVSGTPSTWPNEPAGFTQVAYWNDGATLTDGGFAPDSGSTPFRSLDATTGSLGAITTGTGTIVAAAGSWTSAGLTDPAADPTSTPQYICLANQDAGNNGRFCLVNSISGTTLNVTPIDGSPLVANSTPDADWTATAGWGIYSVVTSGFVGSPSIGGTNVMERFYPAGADGGHDAGRIRTPLDNTKDAAYIAAEVQYADDDTASTSPGGNKQLFLLKSGGSDARFFSNYGSTETWNVYKGSTVLIPTYTTSTPATYDTWQTQELLAFDPSVSDNDGVVQLFIDGVLVFEKDNCSVAGGTYPSGTWTEAYLDMSNNGNRPVTGSSPEERIIATPGPGGSVVSSTAWCAALYASQPT